MIQLGSSDALMKSTERSLVVALGEASVRGVSANRLYEKDYQIDYHIESICKS